MPENELAKIVVDAACKIRKKLKLTDCRLGLLINFGQDLIKDGISRVVNGLKNQLTQSREAAKEILPSPSVN